MVRIAGERDLAYALVMSRVVRPASELATWAWWADSTLGVDLGVAQASRDEVYDALDWLGERQNEIEKQLARRHLNPGGIAMFDLSSSLAGGDDILTGRVRLLPGWSAWKKADRVRTAHR